MKKLLEEAYAALCNSGTNVRTLQGLRESEIRDKLRAAIYAPEPYDQQALELCTVCGWKAIAPGEPCLMCEPEQDPHGWMIQGSNHMYCGEYAEIDAKSDAGRISGTCNAYPVYREAQPLADLTDAEILGVFAACHIGKVYPMDFICGTRAMRITEGRAVLAAQKGKQCTAE